LIANKPLNRSKNLNSAKPYRAFVDNIDNDNLGSSLEYAQQYMGYVNWLTGSQPSLGIYISMI